ncbi:hypothetical protein FSP39_008164 [Pinctada imbricata]|uniref:Uncharacterized protein n=1 Tax=Pinctada imbricata TaxID=66713 RepID=A0AA88XQV2_PINIB|nr:hypothetical protein FSP39_008164 [Pinctada imbricata]
MQSADNCKRGLSFNSTGESVKQLSKKHKNDPNMSAEGSNLLNNASPDLNGTYSPVMTSGQQMFIQPIDPNVPIDKQLKLTSTPILGNIAGQMGLGAPPSSSHGTFLPDGDISRIVAAVRSAVMQEVTDMFVSRLNPIIMCVNQLAAENKILHKRVDELEQYGRKNCVRIFGVSEEEKDTTQAVLGLAKDLDVPLEKSEIVVSHRVGPVSDRKPRAIIARITNYEASHKLMKSSYKFAKLPGRKGVSINQDLTKQRSKLPKDCRDIVKMGKAKSSFVFNGKIFLVDQNDKRFPITCLDDLMSYKRTYCPDLLRQNT